MGRQEEERDLARWTGPADWDEYGGWAAGPTLDATGYFRTAKHNGKWWLVDPKGKLFFSYGPTGVGWSNITPVTGRKDWFEWLPSPEGEWAAFYGSGKNAAQRYYQWRTYETFNFAAANLQRKYGPDYQQTLAELSHRRLRSWGFQYGRQLVQRHRLSASQDALCRGRTPLGAADLRHPARSVPPAVRQVGAPEHGPTGRQQDGRRSLVHRILH